MFLESSHRVEKGRSEKRKHLHRFGDWGTSRCSSDPLCSLVGDRVRIGESDGVTMISTPASASELFDPIRDRGAEDEADSDFVMVDVTEKRR